MTPLREHAVELAALGVALCAMTVFLPGRQVSHVNAGAPPDLWLGLDEDRGIEVAGRASGHAAFRRAVRDKAAALRARVDLREAHISIWAFDLRAGRQARIR